jgi:hypothetical protein
MAESVTIAVRGSRGNRNQFNGLVKQRKSTKTADEEDWSGDGAVV